MFFVAGISSKTKPKGVSQACGCPACGKHAPLHVIHKYMTPHIFFIPTVRFNSEYIVTCANCASVMTLSKEKGRAFEKDPDAQISPEDLVILHNHVRQICASCGSQIYPGQSFCGNCGNRA